MRRPPERALVLGGSGLLGGHVVRGLTRAGIPTRFTYFRSEVRARELAAELGQTAVPVDLRRAEAVRELVTSGEHADLLIHCAGVDLVRELADVDDTIWDDAMAVNLRAPFIACRELYGKTDREAGGARPFDVVLVAALDAVRLVASPAQFGASQAGLVGLTRALAKELGPRGGRVNLVALGPLSGGIATDLDPARLDAYQRFSALRRVASPEEAARAVLWVALENSYMNGSVIPVTGGL